LNNLPAGQTVINQGGDLAQQELVLEILDVNKEQEEANECVICLVAKKDTAFYPCGHQCLCFPCSEKFKRVAQH